MQDKPADYHVDDTKNLRNLLNNDYHRMVTSLVKKGVEPDSATKAVSANPKTHQDAVVAKAKALIKAGAKAGEVAKLDLTMPGVKTAYMYLIKRQK